MKILPNFDQDFNSYSLEKEFMDIELALEDYQNGKFLVVSDNEDRENEGDLVISSQFCTADVINFMITHGKGLVCIAITQQIADKFGLVPMVKKNQDQMGTAFTVSIDATPEYGVSTGISAADRAKTIALLIDENSPKSCMNVPGHMFPLIAKEGGVIERQGHTEAAVTLSKLVGHQPSGVIVEIIKPNGEMARRDYLERFSEVFGIRYITIESLVRYCQYIEQKNLKPMPILPNLNIAS